jgi:cobalt/nickel transport protein
MTDQLNPSPALDPGAAPPDEPAGSPVLPVAEAPAPPAQDPAPAVPRSFLRRWGWLIVGLVIVAAIVVVLAPLASPDPDGLESVAKQQGWLGVAQDAIYRIFPDYTIPGLDGSASTIVSGLAGVGVVFLLMVGLGWLLRRRKAPRA